MTVVQRALYRNLFRLAQRIERVGTDKAQASSQGLRHLLSSCGVPYRYALLTSFFRATTIVVAR